MLLKFLHKFYTKADIPWVKLVWDNYYSSGRLPGQFKKGFLWWRDIVKILHKFKGITAVTVADGSTVALWKDHWNGRVPAQAFPELFSFAKDVNISFQMAVGRTDFLQNFNLPLSVQEHAQLLEFQELISSKELFDGNDRWKYSWGNSGFSTSKAYKLLIGERNTHPTFHWIWNSKCQMKHKVFFWLLLRDRLSTKDLLRRKNQELDSYTCDLCILQKTENVAHLFLRCNFAKACWNAIGVSVVTTRPLLQILRKIKEKLAVPFYMEIIILMSWSIWTTRNDWTFNGKDPSVEDSLRKFKKEFLLLRHRAKQSFLPAMNDWIHALD
jgi:hypothetical protein